MRRLVVLVVLLASCGKPSPPPAPAPSPSPPPQTSSAPEKKKKKNPPALNPDLAAKLAEAAENLPEGSELRRKMMEKAGVADTPSGPPSKVVRPPPVPDPPGPQLLAAVNDAESAELPAGWPLIIESLVRGDAGSAKPRLELPEGWAAAPAGESNWTMLPAELDKLPRGTYRIRLVLEGSSPRDCTLRLVPARRVKNESEDLHRSQLLVRVHLLRGDKDAAATEAADLVKRQGKLAGAHHLQADALQASGKTEEADAARARAVALDPRGARAPAKNEY